MAQSLFAELQERGEHCEVICIPNGCTDRTAAVAEAFFAEQRRSHPFAETFTCRVAEMAQAGRNHTWNAFVHSFSHPQAEFLYLMDADILFHEPGTIFNMYMALHAHPEAQISTDLQIKDVCFQAAQDVVGPALAGDHRHDAQDRGADHGAALLHSGGGGAAALAAAGPGRAG